MAGYGIQEQPGEHPPQQSRWHGPLKQLQVEEPIRACLSTTCFGLVTLILCLDIATDAWVIVMYGMDGRMELVGAGVMLLALTGLVCGTVYVIQMKSGSLDKSCHMALCLVLNFPLQLGIIGSRLVHFSLKTDTCCVPKGSSDKEWTFTKLKLIQSTFQSAPMMILNFYSMLYYQKIHVAQYVSILISFVSLVFSAALHEKARKERLRNNYIGCLQTLCVITYKMLVMLARVLAIANFAYFFRSWLTFVILTHFSVVFVYFVTVYREVWKVGYQRMVMHSLFCVLAYFPMHNEYRPEGEIMFFYTFFMIENVLMVALPYGIQPYATVHPQHYPGTEYYKMITIVILIGSALGMIFMAIYYFGLHKSRSTIRYSHFSWLEKCCSCLHNDEELAVGVPHTTGLLDNQRNNGIVATNTGPPTSGDKEAFVDEDSGPPSDLSPPPSYRSHLNDSRFQKSMTETDDTLSDAKTPLTQSKGSVFDSDYKADLSESDLDTSRPSSGGIPSGKARRY